ncbi:hypothetical protein NUW54_g13528 [Trametes sanguinea]|uniref:Uncharacterized protein n=1 Tax=Trametes sanguinea TaxID=158606 RepID=A0ACC1ML19_9APHY|nr:hypothetical protein NUW54_g13528 [Trametes sanguinea]
MVESGKTRSRTSMEKYSMWSSHDRMCTTRAHATRIAATVSAATTISHADSELLHRISYLSVPNGQYINPKCTSRTPTPHTQTKMKSSTTGPEIHAPPAANSTDAPQPRTTSTRTRTKTRKGQRDRDRRQPQLLPGFFRPSSAVATPSAAPCDL